MEESEAGAAGAGPYPVTLVDGGGRPTHRHGVEGDGARAFRHGRRRRLSAGIAVLGKSPAPLP
jgi:hypothetical protein